MSTQTPINTKYCRICGAIACGFHFDATSCESCKSFFRRNALKNDELKCFLGGNCEITVDNRKHCKRCRLNKCLAAGMKTRLIYSRKLKWDINYLNDNQVVEDSSNSGEDLLSSDFSDNQCIDESVGNVCDDNISTNISEQQLVSINRPLTDYSTVFNELEANRFTELLNGIKKLQSIVKIRDQTIVDEMSDGFRVMNIKHENGIKDIVQMSKLLSGFSDLCAEDQLVLIKYSSIEINLLRMVSLFNFQECYWDIVLGDSSYLVRLDLFKHHKLIGEMQTTYDCHTEFLQSIGHDWESDPLIIDFLTAILLFNANRPHLSDRTLIKYQQNIYIYLLNRYLQMKYRSELLSSAKYMRLESGIKYLNKLHDKIVEHSRDHHWPHSKTPLFAELCNRID